MSRDSREDHLLELPQLSDRVVALILREQSPADPVRGWAPALHFTISAEASRQPVGLISLRLGVSEWLTNYAGQVAYAVAPEHRGRRYASRALRLIARVAWAKGLVPVWVTCNPENVASRRSCELAGGVLVDVVPLPSGNAMYERGERLKCRYRLHPDAV